MPVLLGSASESMLGGASLRSGGMGVELSVSLHEKKGAQESQRALVTVTLVRMVFYDRMKRGALKREAACRGRMLH